MKPVLLVLLACAAVALFLAWPLRARASSVEGLEVGKPAPVVRLNDQDGQARVVGRKTKGGAWSAVAFYPKAMTPG